MRRRSVGSEAAWLGILTLLAGSAPAIAGGWSSFGSDHDRLKGYTIAAVGTLKAETKFSTGSYERLEWYEFREGYSKSVCFSHDSIEEGSLSGEQAALIMVNEYRQVRLAIIESSIGSIEVSLENPTVIECPSAY